MDFKLSTVDLLHLIAKRKRRVFLAVFFTSLIFSLYALMRPVHYLAEGSFREKGKSNSSFDNRAAMVLIGGNQRDAEGEPIFKSRKVVSAVVRKLGLQATVDPRRGQPGPLALLLYNLYLEWAHFMEADEPLFEDPVYPFKIADLDYPHDARKAFSLIYKDGEVQLKDRSSGAKYVGKVGLPIQGEDFKVTIVPTHAEAGKIYTLSFAPFTRTLKDVTRGLKVQADKNDKSLIKLSYVSLDRFLARDVVAVLMDAYLDYLEQEQRVIHERQIAYLENRQADSFAALKKKMELHAHEVAKDALKSGFIGSDKAIQFFAAHQEQLQAKKEQADLLIKGLRDVVHQDAVPIDRLVGAWELPHLNAQVQHLGELKSLRDSLSLTLWDPQVEIDTDQFAHRVKEWEELQHDSLEIDKLIVALDEKGIVNPPDGLHGKIHFFINFWQEELNKSLHAFNEGSKENFYPLFNDWAKKKESFKSLLHNLKHFIDVQSSAVQEELVHSKEIEEEFKGIDLQISQDLFKRYLTQLEELQAQERHLAFLKEQIKQEEFAISSLSSIMQDPIANDLVNRAAALELAIRDPKNRSEKEQARMHDELNLERNFLSMHLEQTLELNKIKQSLMQEKFTSLQRATLGFLHRQISFLEHQIKDLIQSKITSLEQERELYQEQIQNLGDQLATYPEKWVRDELLKQAMQIQQMQAQEITRIVENKNITSNLELIQSSPLDEAFPPPLPLMPMTPLYAFLGGFLGFLLGICSILAQFLFKGIPLTPGNVELQNQKVLGRLQEPERSFNAFLDSDLETFRAILIQMRHSLLIAGSNTSWAKTFATYARQTGQKVLFIDLDFNTSYDPEGLCQYLKGGPNPRILSDTVSFSGTTRSYLELLCQKKFSTWLSQVKGDYDLIVASIACPPYSATVVHLSQFFEHTILVVQDEKMEQLKSIFKEKRWNFIFASHAKENSH